MKRLKTITRRGKFKGEVQYPKLDKDGYYTVSPTKRKIDYIKVRTLLEVYEHYKQGFHVRMSHGKSPAGLICPQSIVEY